MSARWLLKRARPAHWPLALAGIVAAAVLLGGCSSRLMASDLAKLPEGSIVYPGSKLVRTITNDPSLYDADAELIRFYEVNATQDQIAGYYHDKLTSLGWKPGQPCPYLAPSEPEYYYLLGSEDIFLTVPAAGSSPRAIEYEYDLIAHNASPRPYPQGWNCATSGPSGTRS